MAELELISSIERALSTRGGRVLTGPGDDAAVTLGEGVSVTSVDTVVEGVHFERATHAPADVGHKALATALSDIAAMGAAAGEAYVSLVVPSDFGEGAALELVGAMEALASRVGVTIAGGDVVVAPTLCVSVTVVGSAPGASALVYRSGAQAGDLVGVTGALGAAGAALLILAGHGSGLAADRRGALIGRHRRPEPRLEWGVLLAAAGATAMIDVSDGIATDAAHIAERSGVALEIELARLPLADGVAQVARAAGRDPAELAASAGDDYELLFTAPPHSRATIEARLGEVSWLGAITAGAGVRLRRADGTLMALRGFEHG